mmetsp:Transcript_101251/g.287082  ORF Transcript_101251/g.287082 Transcript_101251/m.287082 type:complete len:777 (+) Transcript_101251:1934-4264(+)
MEGSNCLSTHCPTTVAEWVDTAKPAVLPASTHPCQEEACGRHRGDAELDPPLPRGVALVVGVVLGLVEEVYPRADVVAGLHADLPLLHGGLQGPVPRGDELPRLDDLESQLPVLVRALVVHVPRRHDARVAVELLDVENVLDALHGARPEARHHGEVELVLRRQVRLLLARKRLKKHLLCLEASYGRLFKRLPRAGAAAGVVVRLRPVQALQDQTCGLVAGLLLCTGGQVSRTKRLVKHCQHLAGGDRLRRNLGPFCKFQTRVLNDDLVELISALLQSAARERPPIQFEDVEGNYGTRCHRAEARSLLLLLLALLLSVSLCRCVRCRCRRVLLVAAHEDRLQHARLDAAEVAGQDCLCLVCAVRADPEAFAEDVDGGAPPLDVHLAPLAVQAPLRQDRAGPHLLDRGGDVLRLVGPHGEQRHPDVGLACREERAGLRAGAHCFEEPLYAAAVLRVGTQHGILHPHHRLRPKRLVGPGGRRSSPRKWCECDGMGKRTEHHLRGEPQVTQEHTDDVPSLTAFGDRIAQELGEAHVLLLPFRPRDPALLEDSDDVGDRDALLLQEDALLNALVERCVGQASFWSGASEGCGDPLCHLPLRDFLLSGQEHSEHSIDVRDLVGAGVYDQADQVGDRPQRAARVVGHAPQRLRDVLEGGAARLLRRGHGGGVEARGVEAVPGAAVRGGPGGLGGPGPAGRVPRLLLGLGGGVHGLLRVLRRGGELPRVGLQELGRPLPLLVLELLLVDRLLQSLPRRGHGWLLLAGGPLRRCRTLRLHRLPR